MMRRIGGNLEGSRIPISGRSAVELVAQFHQKFLDRIHLAIIFRCSIDYSKAEARLRQSCA